MWDAVILTYALFVDSDKGDGLTDKGCAPGNDIGKIWGVKAEYKNTKTDAVRLIRLYRELGGE